jgi:hypothetical protein
MPIGGLLSFGSIGKQHHILFYNSAAYFLALVIADKALLHIESLEDLLEMEIPPGQDEIGLMFKDSILDLPILRKYTKGKDTTEEPMPKHAFTRILRAMLEDEQRRFNPELKVSLECLTKPSLT